MISPDDLKAICAQEAIGLFDDICPAHDGGVAHPTDGSTGNALQQTEIDAYFWEMANGGASASVTIESAYPVQGSRILLLNGLTKCSSYTTHTYSGGCKVYQTDPGSNTATGGSPLFMADFSIGVLADHKTKCSLFDNPPQAGCTIINSAGGSIAGITLFGQGEGAGGNDMGIRVAADNFSVQDTAITGFFGGPGIEHAGGVNASYDWNYGTNVDTWWCNNQTQFTAPLGAMDLPMVDGELSHNQYSTGCAFAKNFTVSAAYPYFSAIHVSGSGNLVDSNLAQADAIGFTIDGQQQRVTNNRGEYTGRENIYSTAQHSTFTGNVLTSACLDHNLPNIRSGSPNNGRPQYPLVPTTLPVGYVIEDPYGNVEQVLYGDEAYGNGTTDLVAPAWPALGALTVTTHLVWENIGPWEPGLTSKTDAGLALGLTRDCFSVVDLGQGNIWEGNQGASQAGVDGPSYARGTFFIAYSGASTTGNTCVSDQADANGNGQCYWGGDRFSNGGPANLQPNGRRITASGGGTAWVGDYTVLSLTDTTPKHYNNFQGMASGTFFWVTSTSASNVIDSWGLTGGGSLYGHPSLLTCDGNAETIGPNQFREFYYDEQDAWMVTQVNCPPSTPTMVSLIPSSNPSALGTTLLLTASVQTNDVPLTGSVAFSDDGAQIGTSLLTDDSAILSTAKLSPGQHTITATYSGDMLHPAGSTTLSERIQPVDSLVLSPTLVPSGTVGSPYSETLLASGGLSPYQYRLTDGSLPSGLNLSSAGQISGTPTESGSSTFNVTVNEAEALPFTGSGKYTLTIYGPGATGQGDSITITATSATSIALRAGAVAVFDFAVAPGSATFANSVAMSVTGLPQGARATLSPATLPAQSSGSKISLVIQTTASSALFQSERKYEVWLSLMVLPMFGIRRLRQGRSAVRGAILVPALILTGLAIMPILGCGVTGTIPDGVPYMLTLTAMSGSVTQTATVTLTVK